MEAAEKRYLGGDALQESWFALQRGLIELDRGRIDLVREEAFSKIVNDVYVPTYPFIGAYTILVRSLATVEEIFNKSSLPMRRSGQTLIAPFPDELGRGVWMFVQAASA